jgi:thiol-disulfide isomerase/thioredoxin
MKYFIVFFPIAFFLSAHGQQTVTISGEAYAPDGRPRNVSVLTCMKNPVGDEFIYLAHIPVGLNNTFHYKLPLAKPMLIRIHYWGGKSNIVYVVPGDSIHIVFEEREKADTFKNMMMTFNYKERDYYSGSDSARIAFFQHLQDKTGMLDEPPFRMPVDSPGFFALYKHKVAELYKIRLAFFKQQDSLYHFSADFKTVVANELMGQYIGNLMYLSFFSKLDRTFPKGYFDEVDNYEVTWDKFKNSQANNILCYTKVMYYNRNPADKTPEAKLAAAIDDCLRFKDDSVRNYMLTKILSRNLEKRAANYDDLVEKFQTECTNPAYISGFLAIYNPPVIGKPLPDDVLSASLTTVDGKPVTLKNILPSGKAVLIDFWASWCGPCKREIPALTRLAKRYKDKVDFCYISVDMPDKRADWLKAVKDANFTGAHYLIADKALTDFARIKSIPRYLVIDKNGKLTIYRGPDLLTDPQGFENALKTALAN